MRLEGGSEGAEMKRSGSLYGEEEEGAVGMNVKKVHGSEEVLK